MVKSKQKQPPNDMEECVQDGWVVVKKQKVTILIPPLPITEPCPIPNPNPSPNPKLKPKPNPKSNPNPNPNPNPIPIPNPNPEETPSLPIATKEVDHITPPQPDPPLTTDKTTPVSPTKPVTTSPKLTRRATIRNRHNYEPNRRKTLRICSAPKARNHCGTLLNGHMLVNSKMRALNLERKIQKAGGLNSWLVSLGLGQFVKIFRCKRVGKVQLVNLTMKKLKDMGAHAVGPRRKLMHAIDCLW